MTAQAVTDEQKWKLNARMRLVHERAGNSLSYEALMDAMQKIIDTGDGPGQSFRLIATNPKEWRIPFFETNTPVPTQKLLKEAEHLMIDSSFEENILGDENILVKTLFGGTWMHRDISVDTSPEVLLDELSDRCIFEEGKSAFCIYLWDALSPERIKWQKKHVKSPPWIKGAQNMFFVRGRFGKICLVNVTFEDDRWYCHAHNVEQGWSNVSILKGSRIFYPRLRVS